MFVIFLDFDGPLFPEKIHMFSQNKGAVCEAACRRLDLHPMVKYWFADPFAIGVLNDLKKVFDYETVISSSWADDRLHNQSQIENLLVENHLDFKIHKDWRTPRDASKLRHENIEAWLQAHPEVTGYFILDDTKSAPDLYFKKTYETTSILQSHVFLAHEKDGFNVEQFQQMEFLLQHWVKQQQPVSSAKITGMDNLRMANLQTHEAQMNIMQMITHALHETSPATVTKPTLPPHTTSEFLNEKRKSFSGKRRK